MMSSLPIHFGRAQQPTAWLAFVVVAILQAQATPQEPVTSVRLTIDFGDGVQKVFSTLAWKNKMTVFDALQAAEKHPRGIKVAYQGSGDTTFITAIDDAANEGADGRNWRFTVNDQTAPHSSAVVELKAGDTVMWRFAK